MSIKYDEIETYFNEKLVNEKNIMNLKSKYSITPAELVFIYQKNKSISNALPKHWDHYGKRSQLKYSFKNEVLYRIFLMQNGYLSLPFPLFLGILTGYLLYTNLPKDEKQKMTSVVKKYSSKSYNDYVVPEKELDPYIELIKKRLDRQ